MKTKIPILVMAALIITLIISCSKMNDNDNMSKITFHLTDAPAVYDKVNIDIVGIQVIINDSIIDLETQR